MQYLRTNRLYCVAASVAPLCALLALAPELHAAYIFQNIVNAGDPTFNQELGINNGGTISGYFGSGQAGHPNQGYTVVPPGYTSFTGENFPGSVQTQVTGLNNTGVTVGFWSNTNMGVGMDANFGFTDVGGVFTNVNDPLTPVSPTPTNQLLGVNDSNIAAGFYVDAAGNSQGYTYNIASHVFTPVTVTGQTNSTATGINNAGWISGFYMNSAMVDVGFIDQGGVFTTFQAFGDPTMFLGINNSGFAIGTYMDAAGTNHGFLYNIAAGTAQTIDDPFAMAGDGNGTVANGLNDRNQIVGFYVDGAGNTIGFLADPTPEPWSAPLVGLGLAFIVAQRARRRSRP